MYVSTRPCGGPLWLIRDLCPVSPATLLTCLFKLGRKESMDEINQQCCFVLAPASIKEVVKTPSMFLPSEPP